MTGDQIQILQELISLAEHAIRATSPTLDMAELRMDRIHSQIRKEFPEEAVIILEKRHYKQRQTPSS